MNPLIVRHSSFRTFKAENRAFEIKDITSIFFLQEIKLHSVVLAIQVNPVIFFHLNMWDRHRQFQLVSKQDEMKGLISPQWGNASSSKGAVCPSTGCAASGSTFQCGYSVVCPWLWSIFAISYFIQRCFKAQAEFQNGSKILLFYYLSITLT